MPKIIIFGDIDISPLHISVDNCKELTISGKYPRSIDITSGAHHVAATSMSKFDRTAVRNSSNDFMNDFLGTAGGKIIEGTNTFLAGEINFNDDDVLMLQVKQKLSKTEIYSKVVNSAAVNDYVDVNQVIDYKERAPGEKNKWVTFFLCLFFGFLGIHRFYEKKIITGILYLCTLGFFGIGVLIDLVNILRRNA